MLIKFTQCGMWGGEGGSLFSDGHGTRRHIIRLIVHAGEYIDEIQVIWWNETVAPASVDKGVRHGGPRGDRHVFDVDAPNNIEIVAGRAGEYLDQLFVQTSSGHWGRWGGWGGEPFFCQAPPGTRLHGFYGRAGKYVDAIGMIWVTER